MFRDSGQYTVLEFGYEKIVPEIMRQSYDHKNPIIETLRVAPDFAVINQITKEVRLIEVKYRWRLNSGEVLECAKKMHASWNPSYLFIATLDGFYFDEIGKIIKADGDISPLVSIDTELQSNYLDILKDFEKSTPLNKLV